MKKLLLLFLFVPFVFAMYGGETQELLVIDNCIGDIIDISVSASETINDEEYNFTNCNRISNTIWKCPCEQPFKIILNTRPNTLNTYTIRAEYDVASISNDDDDDSSGRSSSGSYYYYNDDDNDADDDSTVINKNNKLEKNTKVVEEVIAGENLDVSENTEEEPSPEEKENKPTTDIPKGFGGAILLVFSIVFIIIGGIGLVAYKFLFDTSDDDEFDEDDVDEIVYDIEEEDQKIVVKPDTKIIVEKEEMSDEELENIVGELKKKDKPKDKKIKSSIEPTVKDVKKNV